MKRKAPAGFAMLLAVIWLGGCASPQFSRIDSNRELYESWPLEVRQAVLDGRAEKGMTPEMVNMALGKPSEVVGGSSPAEEIWIYRSGGEGDPWGGYPPGYPGTYPGTIGGSGIGVQPSIGIGTGGGGTIISPSVGVGTTIGPATIGTGGMGTGIMTPMPMPSSPVVEREVVFRDGVVYRADNPPPKS
jgi:hypothetical protein